MYGVTVQLQSTTETKQRFRAPIGVMNLTYVDAHFSFRHWQFYFALSLLRNIISS